MSIYECEQIIKSLEAENNTDNKEIIQFYKAKLRDAYITAISTAFKSI